MPDLFGYDSLEEYLEDYPSLPPLQARNEGDYLTNYLDGFCGAGSYEGKENQDLDADVSEFG